MDAKIEIFICYAHKDELLLNELLVYLGGLQRQGLFNIWYDRKILAGKEWPQEIDKHLKTASIILLLVSQHFMNSDYCYLTEMTQAIERHRQGSAHIIPIILRPVYWRKAPFAKIQALPADGKPVVSWQNLDEAFFNVAEGIRMTIEEVAASNF